MRRMKKCSFLALGFAVMFAGMAGAVQVPDPVVYLKMDGDLINSGTGGAAYNGVLEGTSTTLFGAPVYNSAKNNQGLCLNPNLNGNSYEFIQGTDQGSNVAIEYTMPDSGTISMWYQITAPAYAYQQLFNNSVGAEVWEGWVGSSWDDPSYAYAAGARVSGWRHYNGSYPENSVMAYLESGGWHNFTFTWERHDTDLVDTAWYIDGIGLPENICTDMTWTDPGQYFYIGGNHDNANSNGYYDEVKIFDQVLTPEQVTSLVFMPGDANLDGKVDGSDVTILAGNWQKGVDDGLSASWGEGDFNGDGKVDGSDVTILAGNWQAGVTAVAASVPEPSMIVLLLAAISGLCVIRRR